MPIYYTLTNVSRDKFKILKMFEYILNNTPIFKTEPMYGRALESSYYLLEVTCTRPRLLSVFVLHDTGISTVYRGSYTITYEQFV
jgi:hypothetical protein